MEKEVQAVEATNKGIIDQSQCVDTRCNYAVQTLQTSSQQLYAGLLQLKIITSVGLSDWSGKIKFPTVT